MKRQSAAALLTLLLLAGGYALWRQRPSLPEKGMRLMESGDLDGALDAFRRALERKSWPPADEERMRNEMARAYLMKDALENAEDVLKGTVEKFPKSAYAHLALGFVFMAKDLDAYAAESFEAAAAADPSDSRANTGLGALRFFHGDFEAARREYETALEKKPEDHAALIGLANVHAACGRFAEAEAAYEGALAQLPMDTTARLGLAQTLLSAGETARAEAEARRAPDGLDRQLFLGDLFRASGRSDEAGEIFRNLVGEDQRKVLPLLRLAHWRLDRGESGEARALLDKAAQLIPAPRLASPSFSNIARRRVVRRQILLELHLAWSRLHALQNRVADARLEAERALQTDSKDLAALRQLTEIARLRGDLEDRLKWAGRAVDVFPDHCLARLDRAEALLDAGRRAEALEDARRAEASCPALPRTAEVLARARARK